MSTGPLLPGPRQGWMNRTPPPNTLRDAPCRRRPDLFTPTPQHTRSPSPEAALLAVATRFTRVRQREAQELAYRYARAQRICNGAPGYDEPCPLRMECLRWAIQAKERIVAGGVVVTKTMIMGYHDDPEGGDRAAEEAGTPQDWANELAIRYRARARKRQPNQGAGEQRERESA